MDKMEFLRKLGTQVAKTRIKKNWSQTELAFNCNKNKQAIQRLESGNINPTTYFLKEVAVGLNVHVKDLLDFD